MGKTYRHPAMKQLKDQQTRYAPRERRLEQVERAEQLLGEIEGAKRYPYEYLCYRITGFRPDGWPALVAGWSGRSARSAAVRGGPFGDGSASRRACGRGGFHGRRGEQAIQRDAPNRDEVASAGIGGAPVCDRRPDESGVSRVELAAICHGPSRAGRARLKVSATHRGRAGRDYPPRSPHGAGSSRAVRPGRDRAEDRT